MRSLLPGELCRKQDCFDHTLMVSDSASGDVECGAVINRSPDDRQPKRHVHRLAKGETFYRDQALVVIARRNGVEFAAPCAHKNRIRRIRTADVDSVRDSTSLDRGLDFVPVFGAKEPVLAG